MSAPRKQAVSVAIAWRSGLIGFTRPGLVPAGAIAFASGPHRQLRRIVESLGRLGMGKSAGSLLVPGVPEAATANDAVDALSEFSRRVKSHLQALETSAGRAA